MILVTICVSAALTLGLIIFVAVHCRRQVKACVQDPSTRMQNGPRSLLWSLQDPLADRYGTNFRSSWCCDNNDVINDVTASASASELASTPEDQICCSCVVHTNRAPSSGQNKKHKKTQNLPYESSANFEFLHADFSTLNTKSSFLGEDDDYFLSLSKDRRFLTPIPVSEL